MDFTNQNLRFKRVASELSSEFDDEIVVLHLESNLYFGMEGVAARIWQELETPKSLDTLSKLILAEFDVDEMQCREDLQNFLERLERAGLASATIENADDV